VLERLIEIISGVGAPGLVLLAMALTYAETAIGLDLVVPGEAGLVVVGAAANGEIGVVPIIAAAAVGATAGDCTSYWLGRRFGHRLLDRFALTRRLRPGVERAEAVMERRGPRAVFFGRFVGALRAVVPLVAGMARMPFGRFLVWNVAASIVWCTTVVLVGFHVGLPAARFVDRAGIWSYLVVAVVALVLWLRHRRSDDGGDAGRDEDQTSSPKASQSGFSQTKRTST
jgi:membrane-associated protein